MCYFGIASSHIFVFLISLSLRQNSIMSGPLETVVRLAWTTFRSVLSDKSALLQKVVKVQEALSTIKIEDVGITESQIQRLDPKQSQGWGEIKAPVGFVEVFEDDLLAVGAFLLKEYAVLPMHNHPTMFGVLKVIHGRVRIKSFDLLDQEKDEKIPKFLTADSQPSSEEVRKLRFRSETEYTSDSEPCLVTPSEGNIHRLEAVGGPAIFLDFISPPYNPHLGRDCDYFQELHVNPNEREGADGELSWCKQIPCPSSYYCVRMDYFGPSIKMEEQ